MPEGSPSESVEGVTHAPITFVNQTDIDVLVYWLNYSGEREFWFSLAPGESHFENTWLTHPWVVVTIRTAASVTCWQTNLMGRRSTSSYHRP